MQTKFNTKQKLQSKLPTVVNFNITTPKCPRCNSEYFIQYEYCDHFECLNPNCDFAFCGSIQDLKWHFIS